MNIKYFQQNPPLSSLYLHIQLNNNRTKKSRLVSIESTHSLTRARRRGPTGGSTSYFLLSFLLLAIFEAVFRVILVAHTIAVDVNVPLFPSIISSIVNTLDPSSLETFFIISQLDHFGQMYTIEFPSGGSKMFQREIFYLSPDTYIFTMNIKYLHSLSIESSPNKNQHFSTTHEDHPHPPCTAQWYLTSAYNIEIVSFPRSLKYIIIYVNRVFNLQQFHNELSIALRMAENINIKVLPPFLDFYRSSTFILFFLHIKHEIFNICT